MKKVTVAATQMTCSWDRSDTLNRAMKLVEQASEAGANIILLQELFETPYFCQVEKFEYFKLATSVKENQSIQKMMVLAKKLHIVLPISFFEHVGNCFFNSVAIIDADGELLGVYRKTHIPDGYGYEEKFYFSPGDTGFRVWNTKFGRIGVGICWDQWFPETARCLALLGAEILFFPTAIGSEPVLGINSRLHWQHCIQGHAAANILPVVVSNRIGEECETGSSLIFYGSSFIAGPDGTILQQMDNKSEGFITQSFDLDEIDTDRCNWGIFRDRRPEIYKALFKMDASF